MLSDNVSHVFVVNNDLSLVNGKGDECAVSQGDVLQLVSPIQSDRSSATATVLASKAIAAECRKGATVSVPVSDLEEMQNHMRETIDQGLNDLKKPQPLPLKDDRNLIADYVIGGAILLVSLFALVYGIFKRMLARQADEVATAAREYFRTFRASHSG
jgi:hypothetical protein